MLRRNVKGTTEPEVSTRCPTVTDWNQSNLQQWSKVLFHLTQFRFSIIPSRKGNWMGGVSSLEQWLRWLGLRVAKYGFFETGIWRPLFEFRKTGDGLDFPETGFQTSSWKPVLRNRFPSGLREDALKYRFSGKPVFKNGPSINRFLEKPLSQILILSLKTGFPKNRFFEKKSSRTRFP